MNILRQSIRSIFFKAVLGGFLGLVPFVCLAQNGHLPFAHGGYGNLEKLLTKKDGVLRVVNFWATWCAPCVAEIPYFVKAEQDYKGKNIEFIYVSLDFKKDVEKKISAFKAKKMLKNSYIYWLHDSDANVWLDKVYKGWSGALPATLLVKSGRKKFAERSFKGVEDLKQFINQF